MIQSFINKVREATGHQDPSRPLVAARLEGAVRFPYGPFRFKASLHKGAEFVVEASSDLQTWVSTLKGIASAVTTEYVDSEAAKFNHRFYRLRADGVAAANVIGYASLTLPPGFSMIANPFKSPDNSIGELFKGWPDGTTLSRFDTRFFKLSENMVKLKKWTNPSEKLNPTEGAIFFNPTSDYKTHDFVGEVMQGQLSLPLPAGFSIRSSLVPKPGGLDELGFPIANGDVIHLFDRDRQEYVLYPYEGGAWKKGVPTINVGEAFWVAKTEPGNWVRTLNATGR